MDYPCPAFGNAGADRHTGDGGAPPYLLRTSRHRSWYADPAFGKLQLAVLGVASTPFCDTLREVVRIGTVDLVECRE